MIEGKSKKLGTKNKTSYHWTSCCVLEQVTLIQPAPLDAGK